MKSQPFTAAIHPSAGRGHHCSGCGCALCAGGRSLKGKPVSERELSTAAQPSASNRGVVYMAPGVVEVKPIDFPKLELDSTSSPVPSERQKRKCEHGAILKVCSHGRQEWGVQWHRMTPSPLDVVTRPPLVTARS